MNFNKNKFLFLIIIIILIFSCNKNKDTGQQKKFSLVIDENSFKRYQLFPIDESNKKEDFKLFFNDMKTIIKNKDVNSLLRFTNENIIGAVAIKPGIKSFIEFWGLNNNAKNSKLWVILEKILNMGGTFDIDNQDNSTIFIAPYTFSKFPKDQYDPYIYGIITNKNTILREFPKETSKELCVLSYDVIKIINTTNDSKNYGWQKIETYNNLIGFVNNNDITTPFDYRAGFKKINNKWELYFIVAGD